MLAGLTGSGRCGCAQSGDAHKKLVEDAGGNWRSIHLKVDGEEVSWPLTP